MGTLLISPHGYEALILRAPPTLSANEVTLVYWLQDSSYQYCFVDLSKSDWAMASLTLGRLLRLKIKSFVLRLLAPKEFKPLP